MATAPLAANVTLKLLSSFLALIFLRTNAPTRNGFGISLSDLLLSKHSQAGNGRLVFGIFAGIAAFERELIRERVRSGLAVATARLLNAWYGLTVGVDIA